MRGCTRIEACAASYTRIPPYLVPPLATHHSHEVCCGVDGSALRKGYLQILEKLIVDGRFMEDDYVHEHKRQYIAGFH